MSTDLREQIREGLRRASAEARAVEGVSLSFIDTQDAFNDMFIEAIAAFDALRKADAVPEDVYEALGVMMGAAAGTIVEKTSTPSIAAAYFQRGFSRAFLGSLSGDGDGVVIVDTTLDTDGDGVHELVETPNKRSG